MPRAFSVFRSIFRRPANQPKYVGIILFVVSTSWSAASESFRSRANEWRLRYNKSTSEHKCFGHSYANSTDKCRERDITGNKWELLVLLSFVSKLGAHRGTNVDGQAKTEQIRGADCDGVESAAKNSQRFTEIHKSVGGSQVLSTGNFISNFNKYTINGHWIPRSTRRADCHCGN